MSTVTVKVLANYLENYNVDGGKPQWKAKGCHEFIFENVDAGTVMYANDLASVLGELISSESDSMNKFEYLSHEVIFHEPTKLIAEHLEQAIIRQLDEANKD